MHHMSVSIQKGLSVLCLLSLQPALFPDMAAPSFFAESQASDSITQALYAEFQSSDSTAQSLHSVTQGSDLTTQPLCPVYCPSGSTSQTFNSLYCPSGSALQSPGSALHVSAAPQSPPDPADLDNTVQNWGQGVQFNDSNQPLSSVEFQAKYNHLNADFIGPEQEKVIWLTFDEGYENGYTESILNTLKEKNCPAVFFVTGQYASENPELMKRMIAEGHAVGNHSWAHPAKGMPSLSIEEQKADLTKLHNYVKEQYQYDMTLFRFPAGIFSEQSMAVAQSMGYRSLFWSFAYADWDPNKQPDNEQTLKKLCGRLHPGSLYLLHAVSATNASILGDFIDQARSQGYEFKLPDQ